MSPHCGWLVVSHLKHIKRVELFEAESLFEVQSKPGVENVPAGQNFSLWWVMEVEREETLVESLLRETPPPP